MPRVKVSSKNQVVIPAEARKKLGLKPGDNLLVHVRDRSIVLIAEPEDYVDAMSGAGRDLWSNVDIDQWLRTERESWEE